MSVCLFFFNVDALWPYKLSYLRSNYAVNQLGFPVVEALTGALNLQEMEFAKKGGGNCEERKMQGKAPKFATV